LFKLLFFHRLIPLLINNLKNMQKYICRICGEIYDPESGDPDHNIAGNTAFVELPIDWQCPTCKANKGEFDLYD